MKTVIALSGDDGRAILKGILGDIEEGRIAPCYLICGDEEYLIRDSLVKIINLILPGGRSDLRLVYVDGAKEDIGGICDSILTPSLIPGVKVVVVKNPHIDNKKDTDALVDVLRGGLPEGNCLILAGCCPVDRRGKLFKTVSDIGVILSFSQIKGEKKQKKLLEDIAKEFFAERGKDLTADALLALEEKTGFNLSQFREALEKLVIYAGDRPLIEKEDVGDVIERVKDGSIFSLTSALAGKDLKRALLTLNDIRAGGVHHIVILSMVYREIRLLLHAKMFLRSGRLGSFSPDMDYNQFQRSVYPEIKKLAGRSGEKNGGFASQHPYVIYNALRNSGRFSFEELVKHLSAIAKVDLMSKTTGKNPWHAIEHLLIDVAA